MTLEEQAKFYASERAKFDDWLYGKGITSYATRMDMWCAWWGRAYLTVPTEKESDDA